MDTDEQILSSWFSSSSSNSSFSRTRTRTTTILVAAPPRRATYPEAFAACAKFATGVVARASRPCVSGFGAMESCWNSRARRPCHYSGCAAAAAHSPPCRTPRIKSIRPGQTISALPEKSFSSLHPSRKGSIPNPRPVASPARSAE